MGAHHWNRRDHRGSSASFPQHLDSRRPYSRVSISAADDHVPTADARATGPFVGRLVLRQMKVSSTNRTHMRSTRTTDPRRSWMQSKQVGSYSSATKWSCLPAIGGWPRSPRMSWNSANGSQGNSRSPRCRSIENIETVTPDFHFVAVVLTERDRPKAGLAALSNARSGLSSREYGLGWPHNGARDMGVIVACRRSFRPWFNHKQLGLPSRLKPTVVCCFLSRGGGSWKWPPS